MPQWPSDVVLCDLIIDDDPLTSAAGTDLATFVTVTLLLDGTERLVWLDGTEFLPLPDRLPNPTRIPVPVTDQPGWTAGGGSSYLDFAYQVTVNRVGIHGSSTYTVLVQPHTGTTEIVVSRVSDGTIGEPVIVPVGGLTLDEVEQALLVPHIQAATPHPAYDDIADLALIFTTAIL